VADGLRTVALAAARWTKKKRVFAPPYPAGGGQIEDQFAIHLGVELEVEVIQLLVGIAETAPACGASPEVLCRGKQVRPRPAWRSGR